MDYYSDAFKTHREKVCAILENIPYVKEPKGWKFKGSFSVGGFEYFGFHESSDLLFVVSSSKVTITDLENLSVIAHDDNPDSFDLNETFLTCNGFDVLDNKIIKLACEQGSILPTSNTQWERLVKVSPLYPCEDIIFCPPFEDCFIEGYNKNCVRIYRGFPYCYAFSFSGNYFVIADDGGVSVWEKNEK